jgi:hypothetical protein
MRQFLEISLFWAVVFVAICLVARFPDSWPGRILFARQGPLPLRREPRSRYLLRWAAYDAGWFAQALLVLGIGWEALRLDPSLAQSLFFQVFWFAVVPLVAVVALLASLVALSAALWRRTLGAERRKRGGAQAIRA